MLSFYFSLCLFVKILSSILIFYFMLFYVFYFTFSLLVFVSSSINELNFQNFIPHHNFACSDRLHLKYIYLLISTCVNNRHFKSTF